MTIRLRPIFATAILLSGVASATAQAQNLFRTGRPNYARTAEASLDPWGRPAVANRYSEAVGRLPRTYVSRPRDLSASDYERLLNAWESYRREALRYQQRYGTTGFVDADQRAYWTDDRRLPCQYRAGRSESLGRTPADFPPRLPVDSLAPDAYLGGASSQTYSGREPSTRSVYRNGGSRSDPAWTASRPVVSFFRSLLPNTYE